MKLATGVDLTILMTGERIASASELLQVITASNTAVTIPNAYPERIRTIVMAVAIQNLEVTIRLPSDFSTAKGLGRISSFPTFSAHRYQTSIQNANEITLPKSLFSRIEVITRHLSSY